METSVSHNVVQRFEISIATNIAVNRIHNFSAFNTTNARKLMLCLIGMVVISAHLNMKVFIRLH